MSNWSRVPHRLCICGVTGLLATDSDDNLNFLLSSFKGEKNSQSLLRRLIVNCVCK